MGPIWSAIQNKNIDELNAVIQSGVDVNMDISRFGWAPLHAACREDFAEGVLALIAAGADLNAKSAVLRWTPLHVACRSNSIACVKALVLSGANIHVVDAYNDTIIRLTTSREIIDFLESINGGRATKAAAIQ